MIELFVALIALLLAPIVILVGAIILLNICALLAYYIIPGIVFLSFTPILLIMTVLGY